MDRNPRFTLARIPCCVYFRPVAGEATLTFQMRWARGSRDSKDSKGLDREKGPQPQFLMKPATLHVAKHIKEEVCGGRFIRGVLPRSLAKKKPFSSPSPKTV